MYPKLNKPHIKLVPSKKATSVVFKVGKHGANLEEKQRNGELIR